MFLTVEIASDFKTPLGCKKESHLASFLGPTQLSVATNEVMESWAGPGNEAKSHFVMLIYSIRARRQKCAYTFAKYTFYYTSGILHIL